MQETYIVDFAPYCSAQEAVRSQRRFRVKSNRFPTRGRGFGPGGILLRLRLIHAAARIPMREKTRAAEGIVDSEEFAKRSKLCVYLYLTFMGIPLRRTFSPHRAFDVRRPNSVWRRVRWGARILNIQELGGNISQYGTPITEKGPLLVGIGQALL